MRICLIIPPSSFLLDEKVFPSLGILKVATSLERSGYAIDVLDLSGVTNHVDAVNAYVASHPYTTHYGITATSSQMPAAIQIADALPIKPMIGGPHATLSMAALKSERKRGIEDRAYRAVAKLKDHNRIIISGDGEFAIHRALVTEGEAVIDADDPGTELFLTNKTFTESGWPARHLIDLDSYHYAIEGERATSVIGQLGCPMKCTFCSGRSSPMLRRMRNRPPEDVLQEIISIHEEYGYKAYFALEDELNISKSMLDLMRGLKKEADARGIEWKLRGFLKAELFTEEQAEAMHAAGFRQLLIGFESGHERILANIQKNATVADNTRAMRIAKKYGLRVKSLMSCGHAGESEETIIALRDWLLEVKPADFDVTVITPYPGSPYYDDAVRIAEGEYCYTAPKTGDKLYMQDVDFTTDAAFYKGAIGAYRSFVWTDHLSRERIVQLRDWVEDDVRTKLNIPFYPTGTQTRHEASMGQLPGHILRSSK